MSSRVNLNFKKVESEIQQLLDPILKDGFGRVTSTQGARRKLKTLFTPYITKVMNELCKEDFTVTVFIRLKDFNKRGYEKVGGETLIDKNDMKHWFGLDIDEETLEKAYLGNTNVRTRLVQSLIEATMHEILHMHQFENSKIPVNYNILDKDKIIKKGATQRLRYYSDKTEISAFALNTAQELIRSLNDPIEIKTMLCHTSNYRTFRKRSSSFWRYHEHAFKNIGKYPKAEEVWKLFLKRVVWYLDELT